jgi:hypothetical protein
MPKILGMEALGHTQGSGTWLAVIVNPGAIPEVGRLDDESIRIPFADGITKPRRLYYCSPGARLTTPSPMAGMERHHT